MRSVRLEGACAFAALCLVASTAGATSIPITMTGHIDHNSYNFSVTGSGLEYRVSTAEGPYTAGLCFETRCETGQNYQAGVRSIQFGQFASWQGVSTDDVSGTLYTAFTFDVPRPTTGDERFTATVPLRFWGEIVGLTEGGSAELFRIAVNGTGDATIRGLAWTATGGTDAIATVQEVDFSFGGTAAQVPEPASAALLAFGGGTLSLLARRRRRPSH